LLYVP